MNVSRKPRVPQGIYAWPAEHRSALDEMLDRNLTYEQIVAAMAKRGVKTSQTAVGAYYSRRLKRAVSAAGEKAFTSNGCLAITVAVPDGFVINARVAEGSGININVTKKE